MFSFFELTIHEIHLSAMPNLVVYFRAADWLGERAHTQGIEAFQSRKYTNGILRVRKIPITPQMIHFTKPFRFYHGRTILNSVNPIMQFDPLKVRWNHFYWQDIQLSQYERSPKIRDWQGIYNEKDWKTSL